MELCIYYMRILSVLPVDVLRCYVDIWVQDAVRREIMDELEFCRRCELWNKRHPDLPQRETYYDSVLCPICHGGQTTRSSMFNAIRVIDARQTADQIDRYLTENSD